ncbi:MAG TPA: PIN domain-containing protein [Steroidobacteraceae bacterium]|nr:PIN domain-containing protein [Steroidobacteraceae bacterium]
MRTNYVLIDYESVQPASIAVLEQECFKVMIFVGEKQAKVSFDVAASLQRLGSKAAYVKMAGSGPNALDFHIAFYIGQLSAAEPDAYFHIISKDTGFDPLVAHLKTKKIFAARSKDVSEIPMVKTSKAKIPTDRLAAILANLRQRGAAKPRTVKTLSSTINALFQRSLSEAELTSLLDSLKQQGVISISGARVSYALPD